MLSLSQERQQPVREDVRVVDALAQPGAGIESPPPECCFVGSYPPRECGIATFTRDTRAALAQADPASPTFVIAINEPGGVHDYPQAVRSIIHRDVPASYEIAADFVNLSRCRIVNVQHEYGLFGGEWGSLLFRFLDRVKAPVVLTLHTVLPHPSATLRSVTRELIQCSASTVVLARAAIDILERDYAIDRGLLRFVPHGVPDVPLMSQSESKRALGYANRTVVTTCGLMSRGKGIEHAIDALAQLVSRFPDLLYVVAGETHPAVRAHEGESYREELQERVRQLGLTDHVRFENRYLPYEQLVIHLLSSDVYLVPYLNRDQIVSGTIAYGLGCGRAIIATPSIYAQEVLGNGLGLLSEPQPDALAHALAGLLEDPDRRHRMERGAYAFGRGMTWPRVAEGYLSAYRQATDKYSSERAFSPIVARAGRFALLGQGTPGAEAAAC